VSEPRSRDADQYTARLCAFWMCTTGITTDYGERRPEASYSWWYRSGHGSPSDIGAQWKIELKQPHDSESILKMSADIKSVYPEICAERQELHPHNHTNQFETTAVSCDFGLDNSRYIKFRAKISVFWRIMIIYWHVPGVLHEYAHILWRYWWITATLFWKAVRILMVACGSKQKHFKP
jgi:hypothetical protein